ncbi:MAG: 50S ribosomal protein L15 [Deltaproteobacteria bacterium]|nr:50S ribosomal protein L15 [Deltaproteobacteria bacterium]
MDLSNLKPAPGSTKRRKRVGRGDGSGHGKTSCRGHKGQGARSGGNTPPGFEGGQMPLQRRVPKRGFRNPSKKSAAVINLGQLEVFASGSDVTPELMVERGLIHAGDGRVKILGDGSLSKPLTVRAHGFSSKAKEKIEALGGKAELLP